MESVFNIVMVFGLLLLGYFAGSQAERRHYKSIRRREKRLLPMVAVPLKNPPQSTAGLESRLVCGSVVISLDISNALWPASGISLEAVFAPMKRWWIGHAGKPCFG